MDSKIILCTNQLATSDLILQNFGHEANGIVIIADEDEQALEPTAWIPVTLLRNAERVKAVLRFGRPTSATTSEFSFL